MGSNAESVTAPATVGSLTSVTAVAAGASHSLVLQRGAVYAWGDDSFGQFGDGSTMASNVPVAVPGLLSGGVTAVAAGQEHSLFVRNGAAYACGYNPSGQLGDGATNQSSVPVPVTGLGSGVTAVAAGSYHSLAIQNGAAYDWGYNGDGRIGDGSKDEQSNEHVPVSGLGSGVTSLAGGTNHSLAIQNGAAFAWGSNHYGQFGTGTTTDSNVPVVIPGFDHDVTSIAAGVNHSLAVQSGKVYAWGGNEEGQLGNGTTTDSLTPVQIAPASLHDIVAVAAGYSTSYALSRDGSLWV